MTELSKNKLKASLELLSSIDGRDSGCIEATYADKCKGLDVYTYTELQNIVEKKGGI